jgi:hypothetical protein
MKRPKTDIAEVMFLTKVVVICGCQFELHQKGRHAYSITSSAATSSVAATSGRVPLNHSVPSARRITETSLDI